VSHAARMGEMRYIYKIMVIKPEGKRPLGRFRFWNKRKTNVLINIPYIGHWGRPKFFI